MSQTKQATVPEEWASDAEEMGVSLSEYVRRMVRAGRRQWGYDHVEDADEPHVQFEETQPAAQNDLGIEELILRNLSTTDGIEQGDLADLITADIDTEIGNALEELMGRDEVEYSPTQGGWVIA